jgi:hypothetical protein
LSLRGRRLLRQPFFARLAIVVSVGLFIHHAGMVHPLHGVLIQKVVQSPYNIIFYCFIKLIYKTQ